MRVAVGRDPDRNQQLQNSHGFGDNSNSPHLQQVQGMAHMVQEKQQPIINIPGVGAYHTNGTTAAAPPEGFPSSAPPTRFDVRSAQERQQKSDREEEDTTALGEQIQKLQARQQTLNHQMMTLGTARPGSSPVGVPLRAALGSRNVACLRFLLAFPNKLF